MIRLGLILALAALSPPAVAQMPVLMQCRAAEPWPGSSPPPGVDVLSPSFGALVLAAVGLGHPQGLVAVVVVRGPESVVILVMQAGRACRGPPVPLTVYEAARRVARGIDG